MYLQVIVCLFDVCPMVSNSTHSSYRWTSITFSENVSDGTKIKWLKYGKDRGIGGGHRALGEDCAALSKCFSSFDNVFLIPLL